MAAFPVNYRQLVFIRGFCSLASSLSARSNVSFCMTELKVTHTPKKHTHTHTCTNTQTHTERERERERDT
ncbi:hypothetical protein LSH36_58g08036, partial [Paralvinella palmiformis]